MNDVPPRIFDINALQRNRARAQRGDFAAHDFLFRESADILLDRLRDVSRPFARALLLGPIAPEFSASLRAEKGVEEILALDPVFDAAPLPVAPESADLALVNLRLHEVNDLPGALVQMRLALKPGGLFLGSLLGHGTLQELRAALAEAEIAVRGGLSPRVSPFADLRDAAALLQRVGFALPVADELALNTSYPDAFVLMKELRGMGMNSALAARPRHFTRRAVFFEAARLYQAQADAEGRVPATFNILTLTGWRD